MKLPLLLATVLAFVFVAYSVSNIQLVSPDVYQADAGHHGKVEPITIKTEGCKHVPAKGAGAIIFGNAHSSGILFSDGGRCEVVGTK